MTTIVAAYMYVLAASLLGMMLYQYYKGTHDLLSFRNVLILGFVVFQVTGAVQSILTGHERPTFGMEDPERTTVIYAAMVTTIVAVFLLTYHSIELPDRVAAKLPTARNVPNVALLWALAVTLLIVGAALRFGVEIPLVREITRIVGIVCLCAACGVAGWIWGPRFFNPFVAAGVTLVVATAGALAMTQAFGRRSLVAIAMAVLWALYYSHFRYIPIKSALWRLGVVALVPLMFVAAVSSVRDAGDRRRTAGEQISEIRAQGDWRTGIRLLLAGQDAARNSLWLIEQYPENFETRHLFTIRYAAVYVIPRVWWPEKPIPLSDQLPHMGRAQKVNRDRLTLGPGIIGHSAAEGGWYALIIYGFVAGLFVRLLDSLVQRNSFQPLIVIPLGASFGHFIGLPRGETAAFFFLFACGVSLTWLIMISLGKVIERSGIGLSYDPDALPEEDPADGSVDEGEGFGEVQGEGGYGQYPDPASPSWQWSGYPDRPETP
jgi:hypothetical protein